MPFYGNFNHMTQGKKIGLKVRHVSKSQKTVKKPHTKPGARKKRLSEKEEKPKKVSRVKTVKKKTYKKPHINTLDSRDLVEELMMNNEVHRRAEFRRRKIMWTGVSVVMLMIVLIWGYSLKKSFAENEIDTGGNELAVDNWSRVADDIGQQLSEIKKGIDKIDSFVEESTSVENSEPLSATSTTAGFPEEQAPVVSSTTPEIIE